MVLNESIRYVGGQLHIDAVPVMAITGGLSTGMDTPVYIYSLPRIRANYTSLSSAFAGLKPHIHYSAKANANLVVLRTLVDAGAGIDAVSWGEIKRALVAGCDPQHIVFAGVGKTPGELKLAVEAGVGWFNVENIYECFLLNALATSYGREVRVALRYNPAVQANTMPGIATGHKSAKFGLNRHDLQTVLANQADYANLRIEGLHVHVGSQLGDTTATRQGVEAALKIANAQPEIHTLNIGGGFPAPYDDSPHPTYTDFATALMPLLNGYNVIIEPGRSIVADAGVLVTQVLYTKAQGGVTTVIVDASMTELMRPALYGAAHGIVPIVQQDEPTTPVAVVGPVCETSDVLGTNISLPPVQHGDLLAILDAGAYGMVMASNYNQRPRPAEVVVDGDAWHIARQRETVDDLLRLEQPALNLPPTN